MALLLPNWSLLIGAGACQPPAHPTSLSVHLWATALLPMARVLPTHGRMQ